MGNGADSFAILLGRGAGFRSDGAARGCGGDSAAADSGFYDLNGHNRKTGSIEISRLVGEVADCMSCVYIEVGGFIGSIAMLVGLGCVYRV